MRKYLRKLIERLFIGKKVKKIIKDLEKTSEDLTKSFNPKLDQKQKAHIFIEKQKIDFCIKEFKSVL